ncbi:MAG TPA: T9SS type A sorting domain-containing protein, partial [Candidatus Cloacimonadota bacterium]|nr:T9SS type A sorting domain-containing protein [Candidatus Cloacimonadota bacterium]
HMLASVGSPTDQDGRVLYLGKSLDGINWTFSSAPVMLGRQNFWDALIYRSALLPEYREGVLEYRNWYGSMNTPQWRIGYTESETSGYLASPQDYQVIHTYDGQNHFQLSWDAPNQNVTGYKVYLNYQEYTILEPGVTSIAFTAHEGAPHIGLVTFAVFAIYPDGESDPVTSFHDLALGTSDEHNPQPQNLRLYPNPFNDHLIVDAQLRGSYSRIDLFNLKGQLVFSRPIDNAFTGRIELEKTLRSGIYFYRLSGAKQVHSGRLLKL